MSRFALKLAVSMTMGLPATRIGRKASARAGLVAVMPLTSLLVLPGAFAHPWLLRRA